MDAPLLYYLLYRGAKRKFDHEVNRLNYIKIVSDSDHFRMRYISNQELVPAWRPDVPLRLQDTVTVSGRDGLVSPSH